MRVDMVAATTQLLHPEIEILPGRRAQHPQMPGIGPGSAIVRLTNTSTRENAYIIRLRCEDPLWQEEWFTVKSLSASPDVVTGTPLANPASSGSEPDQYGPSRRWVKIFLAPRTTRDVLISFYLPPVPASRAGVYPFSVVVETFVTGGTEALTNGHAGRNGHRPENTPARNRFLELPARAIVRPFYQWEVNLTPEHGRRVGRLWRRGEFEVVVTNRGNDWLYCDLQVPRDKDLLLEVPTVRVAVPPPEPDEEQLQRTVPLDGTTRLKSWRGAPIAQPIALSAARVDAPSVPPREGSEDASATPTDDDGGFGAVMAKETSDVQQAPDDRPLVYHPPVPPAPFGLSAFMQFLMVIVGLCAVLTVSTLLFEQFYRNNIVAEPLSLQAEPGQPLTLAGRYLIGSKIYINNDVEAAPETSDNRQAYNPIARKIIQTIVPGQRQYVSILVDERFNGQKIHLSVQRAGFLRFLSPLLPRYTCKTEVQVGKPASLVIARVGATGGSYAPGAPFPIRIIAGPPLKAKPRAVTIGGLVCKVQSWTPTSLIALVPADAPAGTMQVAVQPADAAPMSVNGSITVTAAQAPSSAGDALAAGAGAGAGAGGGAGGSGGAGGGGSSAAAGGGGGGGAGGGGKGGGAALLPALPKPGLPPPAPLVPVATVGPMPIAPPASAAVTPHAEPPQQAAPHPAAPVVGSPSPAPSQPTVQESPAPPVQGSPAPGAEPTKAAPEPPATQPAAEATPANSSRPVHIPSAAERQQAALRQRAAMAAWIKRNHLAPAAERLQALLNRILVNSGLAPRHAAPTPSAKPGSRRPVNPTAKPRAGNLP